MSLLSVLLSLFIERFLGSLEALRRFDWFPRYMAWGRRQLPQGPRWQGTLGLVLLLAPPLALTALLGWFLTELFLLFGLGFAVLVLLYSYGPRDLEAEVEAFIDACRRGDEESAQWYASGLLGYMPAESELARAVTETTLVEAHGRILGVLFWFLLLGPMGALLFRLGRLLKLEQAEGDDEFAAACGRLYAILAWLPAHLCALGYAFSGSFVDAMRAWREQRGADDATLLIAAGLGALRHHNDESAEEGGEERRAASARIEDALNLVRRTVLLWIGVLAVATLAGWVA